MKAYKKVDVSEQMLEDLVRRHAYQIEEGLAFVDHQKQTTGGRLDVLMVDSGKSLIVAELKVVEDDGMLMQGVDYYDYVSSHIEAYARLYKDHGIDPTQEVRLVLIAPSFSQALVNRCKWINLPVSLFNVSCMKFEGDDEIVPIFTEESIPTAPQTVEVTRLEDHLGYIVDDQVRTKASALLEEVKQWKSGSISVDPIKDAISLKINGRVFAYFFPRRQFYLLGTYDDQEEWKEHPIKSDADLVKVKAIMRAAMERMAK